MIKVFLENILVSIYIAPDERGLLHNQINQSIHLWRYKEY